MALVIDAATPKLLEITKALRDKAALHNIMARAGAAVIEKHFVKLAFSNKNRFGRPNTFWKRMRQSVRPESSIAQAAVVMDRPVAQRLLGGPIKARFKKMLTIPISKNAYGKSARQFDDLFVLKSKDESKVFLARTKGKKLELMYALKKSVIQDPDPKVLPSFKEINVEVVSAVNKWLKRRTGL